MPLAEVLADLGVLQRDLARAAGLSRSVVSRLVSHGEWPSRRTALVRAGVIEFLKRHGATPVHLRGLVLAAPKKLAPDEQQLAGAVSPTQPSDQEEEDPMLLTCESLSPEARSHFKLFRSPFADDAVQCLDDVYMGPRGRYIRMALMDAALNQGFIAIIGESGSGKSTLREELEERIRKEGKPVIVIRPHIIGVEPSDARGKMLKAGDIANAIVATLAPTVTLKSDPQARYRQVTELLKSARSAGFSVLLVLEEAHRLPLATLKHLKGYLELKDGLRRLMGICLIGQTELKKVMNTQNPEVREIVQRCEQFTMPALDDELRPYLELKFQRVGTRLNDVLADDAVDAIRARLVSMPRGGRPTDAVSMCYPLVVNNLLCRAMNAAATVGWPQVDAQVIAGC